MSVDDEMFGDLNPLDNDTPHNFSELESPYLSHSLSRLALEKCYSPSSPNILLPQLSPMKWSPTDPQISTPPKLPDASQSGTTIHIKEEIEEDNPTPIPLPLDNSTQPPQQLQIKKESEPESESLPTLSPEYYTSDSEDDSDINMDQPNLRRSTVYIIHNII